MHEWTIPQDTVPINVMETAQKKSWPVFPQNHQCQSIKPGTEIPECEYAFYLIINMKRIIISWECIIIYADHFRQHQKK